MKRLSPPVSCFTDRSMVVPLLLIICVIYVLCLSCFRVCSLLPCGHLLGKDWPLGSRLWCLILFLSLTHVVSWGRCGTWLYRFLLFAATFLTYIRGVIYLFIIILYPKKSLDLYKSDIYGSSFDSKMMQQFYINGWKQGSSFGQSQVLLFCCNACKVQYFSGIKIFSI